ncbi:MAG TPA: hypothetical protein V6D28_30550 [Leptolyngbyaceae cyanobacterium]
MTQRRKKSQLLWIVLGLRIILFLAEIGVGLWSRSLSLLAGSGHIFWVESLALLSEQTAQLMSLIPHKRPYYQRGRRAEKLIQSTLAL